MVMWCGTHREPGSRNLRNKQCLVEGCTKQPCFASTVGTPPQFCGEHKSDEMHDTRNKPCTRCNKQARVRNAKKEWVCEQHRDPGAPSFIKSCEFLGCNKVPMCGVISAPPTHCLEHIADVDCDTNKVVYLGKPCSTFKCARKARFGYLGTLKVELLWCCECGSKIKDRRVCNLVAHFKAGGTGALPPEESGSEESGESDRAF